jgi:hypothetical protein
LTYPAGPDGNRWVEIDSDAAGYGWFIDATPGDNSEFVPTGVPGEFRAPVGSPAYGRIDLLTVLSHEMGHVLGLGDLDPAAHPDEVMTGTLAPGIRRLPVAPAATPFDTSPAPESDHVGVTVIRDGYDRLEVVGEDDSVVVVAGAAHDGLVGAAVASVETAGLDRIDLNAPAGNESLLGRGTTYRAAEGGEAGAKLSSSKPSPAMLWSLPGQTRFDRAGLSSPKIALGGVLDAPNLAVSDDKKKLSKGRFTRAFAAKPLAMSVERHRPADESDLTLATSLEELARSQAAEYGIEIPNGRATASTGSPNASKLPDRHRLVELAAATWRYRYRVSRFFRRNR